MNHYTPSRGLKHSVISLKESYQNCHKDTDIFYQPAERNKIAESMVL